MLPLLLPCPCCQHAAPLATELAPSARVRCPHCHHEMSVQKLLQAPIPSWEEVLPQATADGLDATELQTEDLDSAASINPGAQTLVEDWDEERIAKLTASVAAAKDAEAEPDSDSDSEPEIELAAIEPQWRKPTKKPDWSSTQPITHERFERLKRPRRSPFGAIVQVILGGLLAVPLSLLLIWHWLGTDIGDAGPWVGKYVPWIVPEKFRPYPTDLPNSNMNSPAEHSLVDTIADTAFPDDTVSDNSRSDDRVSERPITANNLVENNRPEKSPDAIAAEASLPLEPDIDHPSPLRLADAPTATVDPLEIEVIDNPLRSIESVRSGEPEASAPALPIARQAPTTDAESGPAAADSAPETGDAQRASSLTAELDGAQLENSFALIRQADAHLEDWSVAIREGKQDLKTLAQSLYAELANLALMIDRLPPRNSVLRAIRGQLKPLGRKVARQAEVRSLIDQGARFWVESQRLADEQTSSRFVDATATQSYGLAMILKIDAAYESPDGESWTIVPTRETRLGEPELEIRVAKDLMVSVSNEAFEPQKSLFLLGSVRPLSQDSENGQEAAPQSRQFVASYLQEL